MGKFFRAASLSLLLVISAQPPGHSETWQDQIFDPGPLKPIDSTPRVKVGDTAPDFTLPALSGQEITLSRFRGKKNVVLSFVPAAWTPVCSDQWAGYNIARSIFDAGDAVLIGITVDNRATLNAWTRQMGRLWFDVASDFWPHGQVSDRYGILRTDGVSERALFVVDKKGILRYVWISDINKRPDMKDLATALRDLGRRPRPEAGAAQ